MNKKYWVIITVLNVHKDFQFGAKLIYHKIVLSNTSSNDRVFRWKQKIEKFGPLFVYMKGQHNEEVDVLAGFLR